MDKNIFTVEIGGAAGQGVKSSGLMLAKVATRSGLHIYTYTEYPSLVRGGHNVMQISISREAVTAPSRTTNLLVALNQETIDLHLGELIEDTALIFDEAAILQTEQVPKEVNSYPIPLSKLAQEAGGKELLGNMVALGGLLGLLGGELSLLQTLISEEFAGKGEEMVKINSQAAASGFNFMKKHFANKLQSVLAPVSSKEPRMVINGNEAVSLGAIAGGMQFASIYPMTPITNILHSLASHQEEFGYIYKQPEDEIAAVNMAIGASFAGVRAMTATSGGGFCLMTEGLGLAGITETPLVVILGMRPGPSTGMPTWSDQGDLEFALHASHGDFPRIVLAAGDAAEAFALTRQAFNLADKYQTPVTLIVDKNICEGDQSLPLLDNTDYEFYRGKYTAAPVPNYQRYEVNELGISTRTIPGVGNYFMANSYEHDELGLNTEKSEVRQVQMQKRMSKLEVVAKMDMPQPELVGPKGAQITIVSWGSNKGAILQAMQEFENVNFLHLTWMNPFPAEAVKEILSHAKHIIGVEANFTGQLMELIRAKTGIEITNRLLKYDGRPIYPEEISEKIKSVLQSDDPVGPAVVTQNPVEQYAEQI